MQQPLNTVQKQSKRQINWIGIILFNVFIAQIVYSIVKNLKERPFDIRAFNKRYLNPQMLKIAGRGTRPQAIVQHVGRKSGRNYTTPVAVAPITHGFAIPLAYGTDVDWSRNILAAGGCTIQWQDQTYTVIEPEIVEVGSIISEFHPFQQIMFRGLKVKHALKVQISTDAVDYTSSVQ